MTFDIQPIKIVIQDRSGNKREGIAYQVVMHEASPQIIDFFDHNTVVRSAHGQQTLSLTVDDNLFRGSSQSFALPATNHSSQPRLGQVSGQLTDSLVGSVSGYALDGISRQDIDRVVFALLESRMVHVSDNPLELPVTVVPPVPKTVRRMTIPASESTPEREEDA